MLMILEPPLRPRELTSGDISERVGLPGDRTRDASSRPFVWLSAVGPGSVLQQGVHVLSFELGLSVQELQLDQKREGV